MDARKCLNGGWFGPSHWSLTSPHWLHQTPPSTVAFTKSPTIGSALSSDQPMPHQSQMEGYARHCGTSLLHGRYKVPPWSTIFKEMSIKIHRQFKVNLLSFPLLCQSKPFHANPLLQRQSCWIGSRAARNMSPCIHLALLPIKWKSANRTTIGQSKANWTQTWGQSKGISASKERTKADCQTLHLGI